MRLRASFFALALLSAAGCHQHPLTDYRPLDKAGMFSGNMEELKKLNISEAEIAQVVKLKQAQVSDDTCVALISAAHSRHQLFTSSDSVANLISAGYTEYQVLDFAKAGKLDSISGDAVMLRLIGLSEPTVQAVLQRRMQDLPVLGSGEISRLKNTGLTEKQILERINQGQTDQQAEKEIAMRETLRNHANTSFVRTRGRRRH